MNKHLQNYQIYQKHLARKERLVNYLDNRPEVYSLDYLCSFLESQSKRLTGAHWDVRADDIAISEKSIQVRFSWCREAEKEVSLPIWFLDDPEKYYREMDKKEEKKNAAKKEKAELWEKFKAEHGKK